MQCPSCKGKGYSTGFGCPGFKPMFIPCDICQGSGELPEGMVYDPNYGEDLKIIRRDADKTLREQAQSMGISASELSRRERGFFKDETTTR